MRVARPTIKRTENVNSLKVASRAAHAGSSNGTLYSSWNNLIANSQELILSNPELKNPRVKEPRPDGDPNGEQKEAERKSCEPYARAVEPNARSRGMFGRMAGGAPAWPPRSDEVVPITYPPRTSVVNARPTSNPAP